MHRILVPERRMAMFRVIVLIAPLAEGKATPQIALLPLTEDTLMMRPSLRGIMWLGVLYNRRYGARRSGLAGQGPFAR